MSLHFAPGDPGDVFARIVIFCIFIGAQFLMIFNSFIDFGKENSGRVYLWIFLPFWILFSLLWLWSYFVTSWLDAGSVKAALEDLGITDLSIFYQSESEIDSHQLPEFIRSVPRCQKCGLPKPERTHHCSDCNLCYFRFDHHCPIVGNCIALNNMKAFMLFLFYSSTLLILITVNLISFAAITRRMNIEIAIIYSVFCMVLGFALIAFGCEYVPRVCINITTLEQIGGVDPITYDKGRKENFQQVFGRNWFFWWLPTKPDISGFTWAGYNFYEENNNNTDQTSVLSVEDNILDPIEA